ncbi:MAG: D-alanine--D-alanine ligase [Defluviitaleaceae bacterium]|nr:D-alanine--D-alanine ligase [Defluviitaleaceae bacterium]
MTKINVAVIFGGPGPEHDVSKSSAINIFDNLDTLKYNIIPIYISKENEWFLYDGSTSKISNNIEIYCASVVPSKQSILRIVGDKVKTISLDVAFSIVHGKLGEDGTIQGVFEAMEIPYVGCSTLSSAVCMDKTYTKLIANSIGIPTTEHIILKKHKKDIKEILNDEKINEIKEKIGFPCIVKPSSSGSSVGTAKVKNKKELLISVSEAFEIDNKIMIEKYIKARELECAILGSGDNIICTLPGEILTTDTIYSYDAKYNNPSSKNIIPAKVSEDIAELAKEYSMKLFEAVDGDGMCRVDFFLDTKTNILIFNEINTIPGFTDISMYPKLLVHEGITNKNILDKLIEMAISKYE